MSEFKKLSYFVLAVYILALLVLSQGQEETEDEKQAKCKYLNSVRANFTICCTYPILVIWRWQWNECNVQCQDTEEDDMHMGCCHYVCCMTKLGVFTVTADENGVLLASEINFRGLVYSFMLSIGNDSLWDPVVNNVVSRCYDQFGAVGTEFDCDVIPLSLYEVIRCSYNQNFLQCPTWNSHGIEECKYTYDYVSQCF